MVKVKAKIDHLTVGNRTTGLRTLAKGEVGECDEDRAKQLAGQGKLEVLDGDGPSAERAAALSSKGDKAETAVRRGPGVPPVERQTKKG